MAAFIDRQFDMVAKQKHVVPSAKDLRLTKIPRCGGSLSDAISMMYGNYRAYLKKRGLGAIQFRKRPILSMYRAMYPDDRTLVEEHLAAVLDAMHLCLKNQSKARCRRYVADRIATIHDRESRQQKQKRAIRAAKIQIPREEFLRDVEARYRGGETLEKIGSHYNVTREYIRQVIAKYILIDWGDRRHSSVRIENRNNAICESLIRGESLETLSDYWGIKSGTIIEMLKKQMPSLPQASQEILRKSIPALYKQTEEEKIAGINQRFDSFMDRVGFVPSAENMCSSKVSRCNTGLYRQIVKQYGSYSAYLHARGLHKKKVYTEDIFLKYRAMYPDDRVCVEGHFEDVIQSMHLFFHRATRNRRMDVITSMLADHFAKNADGHGAEASVPRSSSVGMITSSYDREEYAIEYNEEAQSFEDPDPTRTTRQRD